jgi:hypothetical protein
VRLNESFPARCYQRQGDLNMRSRLAIAEMLK